MIAKLEFDLDNESDRQAYQNAIRANKLNRFIDEFYEMFLRKQRKYAKPDGELLIHAESGTYILLDHVIEKYFEMQNEIISEE